MLQVTFNYEGDQPIFETLRSLNFKYDKSAYVRNELNYKATIMHDSANKKLILSFSKELSFDQYKHLHKVIKQISEQINASVDDHLALMGYLQDGKKAYIYHGWSSWMVYLEDAKHVSMEGQKVEVYQNNELLYKGILMAVLKDEEVLDDFTIIQCTLITKTGEKTIKGENIKIVPTGEF